jgi:hypothetical protein
LFLLEKGRIDFVLMGSRDCFEIFKSKNKNIKRFYNVVDKEKILKHKKPVRKVDAVSLFMPFTSRKNIINQICAMKLVQEKKPYLLYLNNLRMLPSQSQNFFNQLFKFIGVAYVDLGWMKKPQYYEAIQKVKAGLQVTINEAHNLVLHEHIILGTPVVYSSVVDWLPKDEATVYNLDSPVEISEKISNVIENPEIIIKQQKASDKYLKFAIDQNRKLFEELNI